MLKRSLHNSINITKRTSCSIPLYKHLEALGEMYSKAPISGLINVHKIEYKNIPDSPHASAIIRMESRKELNHTAGSMHGMYKLYIGLYVYVCIDVYAYVYVCIVCIVCIARYSVYTQFHPSLSLYVCIYTIYTPYIYTHI